MIGTRDSFKDWTAGGWPIAIAALLVVTFAISGCGQGADEGDRAQEVAELQETEETFAVPNEIIGLAPSDWPEYQVIDVGRILSGDAPPDYRDEFEETWGDTLLHVDVTIDEVSMIVWTREERAILTILQGEFDYEAVRDALSVAGLIEDDYRGFELWEDGLAGTYHAAALIEDQGYIVLGSGSEGSARDVLRGLSRGAGLVGYEDNSDVTSVMRRVGTGWYTRIWIGEDCLEVDLRRCQAAAWSTMRGGQYEVDVTWSFMFRDERSAASAQNDIEERLEGADDLMVEDISTDGRFVLATGSLGEDDWYPDVWGLVAEDFRPSQRLAVAAAAPTPAPVPAVAPASPQPSAAPARAAVATPTAAPAPISAVNDITITMAIREVAEQYGDFAVQTYGGSPAETQMGFYDHLLVHDGVNPMTPFAASEWSIDGAGNELTLVIRKDLRVNTPEAFAGQDFGYLNAHDVAWNMNRQNSVVNLSLGAAIGAQLGGTFGEAVAVDEYTVKAPLVTDIFWALPITEFDLNDTSIRLDSKAAYDAVGSDAIKLIPIGSGPFTMGEWVPNSHGEVHAVPDHWIEPPHIGKFRVVQAPEITTRMAMMQTGDADIGSIDFGRLRELESKGLKFITTMSDKDTMTLSAIWPGNLWTDVNAKTEEALEPWLSPVYSEDYAWIGCPWEDKCDYTDDNNPAGMSDMEQARLVRWGLSHAVDRQGIVDVLHAGVGTPIYLELMGPKFPGWRPDRTVNAAMVKSAHEKYDDYILGEGTSWKEYPEYDNAAEPNYEWPWTIPTDRAEAERLLDLAGFPRGSDGVRFEVTLNKYACETGPLCLEQADAVATDWEAIGVRVGLLNEEYGGVVVPRMRDRTQAFPVIKNCSVETANYPFDWPPPPSDSTFSRPAWGCSFESRFLDYMYININLSWDKQKREDLHLDMVDYYYYWQLYSGLVQLPRGVAANPETVDSWQSRSSSSGFWGRPQHIVPAR